MSSANEVRVIFRGIDQISRTTRGINRGLNDLRRAAVRTGAAFGVAFSARSIVEMTDSMTLLRSRVRLVTESQDELNDVMSRLLDIAQRTRSAVGPTIDLYARVARSTADLGLSQAQLLKTTEVVNKAIQVSGATTAEASAGIIQFGQGLAFGRLRGDELRSVMEQLPGLADAIARGMRNADGSIGLTREELTRLGQEGQLSTTLILQALNRAADSVDRDFGQIEGTITQGIVRIGNAIRFAVNEFNRFGGGGRKLADTFRDVSNRIIDISKILTTDIPPIDFDQIIGDVSPAGLERVEGALSAVGEAVNENLDPRKAKAVSEELTRLAEEFNATGDGAKIMSDIVALADRELGKMVGTSADLAAVIKDNEFALTGILGPLDDFADRASTIDPEAFFRVERAIAEVGAALEQNLSGAQLEQAGEDLAAVANRFSITGDEAGAFKDIVTILDRDLASLVSETDTFNRILKDNETAQEDAAKAANEMSRELKGILTGVVLVTESIRGLYDFFKQGLITFGKLFGGIAAALVAAFRGGFEDAKDIAHEFFTGVATAAKAAWRALFKGEDVSSAIDQALISAGNRITEIYTAGVSERERAFNAIVTETLADLQANFADSDAWLDPERVERASARISAIWLEMFRDIDGAGRDLGEDGVPTAVDPATIRKQQEFLQDLTNDIAKVGIEIAALEDGGSTTLTEFELLLEAAAEGGAEFAEQISGAVTSYAQAVKELEKRKFAKTLREDIAEAAIELKNVGTGSTKEIDRLRLILQAAAIGGKEFADSLRPAIDALIDLRAATRVQEQLDALQKEAQLIGLSNKQRFIALELQKLGADATEIQRQKAEELAGALYESREAWEVIESAADQAARNIQSAFADFLFDPFEEGLRGMLKGFLDTIRRMIAEIAASQILRLIFGSAGPFGFLSPGVAAATSGISAATSGASGGPGGGFGPGPARQFGGQVFPGTAYPVEERGPEIFMPQGRGTVMPLPQAASKLGGNVTYSPQTNIDVSGSVTPEQLEFIIRRNNEVQFARFQQWLRDR